MKNNKYKKAIEKESGATQPSMFETKRGKKKKQNKYSKHAK